MDNKEIVEFGLINRSEGYIAGCLAARSFMFGWVSAVPDLTDEQRLRIKQGLDNIMANCVEQRDMGGDDANLSSF